MQKYFFSSYFYIILIRVIFCSQKKIIKMILLSFDPNYDKFINYPLRQNGSLNKSDKMFRPLCTVYN